jgi:hypothetical protein
MHRFEETLARLVRERWPWAAGGSLAALFGLWLVLLLIGVPLPGPRSAREAPAGAWLQGLVSLQGVRLVEYQGEKRSWELDSPTADVQPLRVGVAHLRLVHTLRVVRPAVRFYQPSQTVRVFAERGVLDPRSDTWVFSDGVAMLSGGPRRFRRLVWHPRQQRLEWESGRQGLLERLLRFWAPHY